MLLDDILEVRDLRTRIPVLARFSAKMDLRPWALTSDAYLSAHIVELRVGASFCCKAEDYDRALYMAKRRVSHELYKGVIEPLYKILHAASDRDHEEVIKLAEELLEKLR